MSRISHLVSNVQVLEATPSVADPRDVLVKCRFLIYRNRVETETDILVGKREDLLRRAEIRKTATTGASPAARSSSTRMCF